MNQLLPLLSVLLLLAAGNASAQKMGMAGADGVTLTEKGRRPQVWGGRQLRVAAERSRQAVTASVQLGADRLLQVVLPAGLAKAELERRLRVSVIPAGAESPYDAQPGLPRAASFAASSPAGLPGGGVLTYQGTLRSAEGRVLQISLRLKIPPTQQAPDRTPFRIQAPFRS